MTKAGKFMKKGEIYFANLDPTIGSEIKKIRPVLIVSNDLSNQFSPLLTVIPLTSQIDKVYPAELVLMQADTQLNKDSKAQCHQIRTISKMRISASSPAGKISESLMAKIHRAIHLHLDMDL